MEHLTTHDLQLLLAGLQTLYAQLDLDAFPTQLLTVLSQVVPAETVSYNEVNLPRQRVQGVSIPTIDLAEERLAGLAQYIHQHPLIGRYQQTRDGRAYKVSDFLSQAAYHRLPLYNEVYRLLDTEYQMAFALPSPPSLIIGLAFNRRQQDFSERDREVLNLLRPHLIQAYRNAEAVSQTRQDLAHVQQAMEAQGWGLIVLSPEGRIRQMTPRAQQWVSAYFGRRPGSSAWLPEGLWAWVYAQQASLMVDGTIPAPRTPLVVEGARARLVVRLVGTRADGHLLLFLEEQVTATRASTLEGLGLSRREAEVLYWVAQGKTNPEVGVILGVSRRTVQKHLERIYAKLGVETRAAATAVALEALGLLRR